MTKATFPRKPTITPASRPPTEARTGRGDGDSQPEQTSPVEVRSSSPATAPSTTELTVTHTGSTGRPVTVLLDDQPIGKVKPGTTAHFAITAGTHWVTVRVRKHTSNVQVIEPRQGDQVTLMCGDAAAGQLDDLGRAIEGISLWQAE